MAVLITMSLSGCGHYTCGTTFGTATCNSSGGGGIGQGGGSTGGLIVYDYFADFSIGGAVSEGMGLQVLGQNAGTYSAGSLTPPVTPPYPTAIQIVGEKFMYVSSSDGTLYSFSIASSTGFLTNIGVNPTSVVGGNSVAANASGNLLFVGDAAGQRISVYTINLDGTLSSVAGSPFSTSGVSPLVMTTDGQSKFLYATSGTNSTAVAAFSIGSGGVLTAVAGSPFATNVAAIAGEPTGQFLFGVSGQSGDTNVHVFSINTSSGILTALSPVLTSGTPRNLALHPNGKWLYTFSEDPILSQDEAVEGFVFDNTTGSLTQMAGSPFTEVLADGGGIEQSGQFLFGLGSEITQGTTVGTVTPYSIDATTGDLTAWTAGPLGFPGIDVAAFALTDAP